jgi:hypothetical protein
MFFILIYSDMEDAVFVGRRGVRIVSMELKKLILENLNQWWSHSSKQGFPGPQPVSIERAHFSKLFEKPYWVCAKTDGFRYIMQCACVKDVMYCVLIDRKMDMHLLDVRTVKNAFVQGTVLDGELIQNHETNQYDFLVYDSVRVCGKDTTQLPHSQRMKEAISIVSQLTVRDHHNIHVRIKHFANLNSVKEYIRDSLPTIPHHHDGLIFTPEHVPIVSGTNYDMFKWKPREKNTVDFWVEQDYRYKNKFTIKLCKGKYMVCMHDHYIHMPKNMQNELPGIVECSYIGNHNWTGLWMRSDKTYPNSVFTMTKTLLNIEENIQIEEFESIISDMDTNC